MVRTRAKCLAVPLTEIYNVSFVSELWPNIWKIETVVPIPKIVTPGDFNDIRPISMTTLWSKIMESFVAHFTLLETGRKTSMAVRLVSVQTMYW